MEIINHYLILLKDESYYLSTIFRLFLAAVFGGFIGMERGRRRRAAGLRTHMLVCIGAALVMITNQYISAELGGSDPSRLGAQVISGIGFLGVGTIIVDRNQQVKGLTTAAGLWACACMGLALGVGFYSGAITAFIFILATIITLNGLEQHIISKSRIMEVYVEFEHHGCINEFIQVLTRSTIKVIEMEIVKPRNDTGHEDRAATILTLKLPKRHLHSNLITEMNHYNGILVLEELQ